MYFVQLQPLSQTKYRTASRKISISTTLSVMMPAITSGCLDLKGSDMLDSKGSDMLGTHGPTFKNNGEYLLAGATNYYVAFVNMCLRTP